MNNYGLNCHLNDVGRMGPVEFGTKELRERVTPHLSMGTDYIFTSDEGWALIPVIKRTVSLR